jgi:hypothetical protein
VNRHPAAFCGKFAGSDVAARLAVDIPVCVHAGVVLGLAPSVGEKVTVKRVECRRVDLLQWLLPNRRLDVCVLVVGVVCVGRRLDGILDRGHPLAEEPGHRELAGFDAHARLIRGLRLDGGRVCSVFAGFPAPDVARSLRDYLRGEVPVGWMAQVDDPHEVLRATAGLSSRVAALANRELSRLEVEAVKTAIPTPHATDLIDQARAGGAKNSRSFKLLPLATRRSSSREAKKSTAYCSSDRSFI